MLLEGSSAEGADASGDVASGFGLLAPGLNEDGKRRLLGCFACPETIEAGALLGTPSIDCGWGSSRMAVATAG